MHFPYYAWQLVTLAATMIPLIGGTLIASHYRKLSSNVSLIAGGFGLMSVLHLLASLIQIFLTSLMIHRGLGSSYSTSTYGMILGASSGAFMMLNLGAWALVLAGLMLTLRDLQSRLWLNAQSVQNLPLVQTNMNANYGMPMTHQEIHGVAHVSNFVPAPQNAAPVSPAPYIQNTAPNAGPYAAPGVSAEQSDATVRLGSHQS